MNPGRHGGNNTITLSVSGRGRQESATAGMLIKPRGQLLLSYFLLRNSLGYLETTKQGA